MSTAQDTFMFVFRETTPERYEEMSTEQTRQALRDWNAWIDSIADEGRLQAGHPLFPAARVVGNAKGVVDGPFAEAKELIGGYVILEAADLDEATAIAERCPSLKYGLTVEIRTVAYGCHLARTLGLSSMREEPAPAVGAG